MQEEFNEIMSKLSENARFALQKGDFYAKSYNRGYMGTEHLLMGILDRDTSAGASILISRGVTLEDIEKKLGKEASDYHTQAYAHIPSHKQCGVGCAAMVVRGKVDEHVLERRPQMAVAQTDEYCRAVVAPQIGDSNKKSVAHKRYRHAYGSVVDYFALAQR